MNNEARSQNASDDVDLDVLIVGAGSSGLAAGVLADRYRVSALVIDPQEAPAEHPRARGLRLRASELTWLWGFDLELRPLVAKNVVPRFIYCESLAGEEITRTDPGGRSRPLTPIRPLRTAQKFIENAFEGRLKGSADVTVQRHTELVSFEQFDDHVVSTLRSLVTDENRTVRSRYLIAADGVSSPVRNMLGVRFPDFERSYWKSAYWEGDLSQWTDDRPAILYFTLADHHSLVGIGSAGEENRWVTFVQYPAGNEHPGETTIDEALDFTRKAIGIPDFPVKMLSTATFRLGSAVLDDYRHDRVFFMGDAAHTFPPTGGFGINTGFCDADNLMWKLAAVLDGDAPDSLLDTYSSERRHVALSNAHWSVGNADRMAELASSMLGQDLDQVRALVQDQSDHVDPTGQDIGFSYADAEPTADAAVRPKLGCRFPHAWVREGDDRRSTLELVAGKFSLVTWGDIKAPEVVEGEKLQRIHLSTQNVVTQEGQDSEDEWFAASGAALVRPDGHISWLVEGDEAFDEDALAEARRSTFTAGVVRP